MPAVRLTSARSVARRRARRGPRNEARCRALNARRKSNVGWLNEVDLSQGRRASRHEAAPRCQCQLGFVRRRRSLPRLQTRRSGATAATPLHTERNVHPGQGQVKFVTYVSAIMMNRLQRASDPVVHCVESAMHPETSTDGDSSEIEI